eukprot:1056386-Pyramimonas_sp.AAC.2
MLFAPKGGGGGKRGSGGGQDGVYLQEEGVVALELNQSQEGEHLIGGRPPPLQRELKRLPQPCAKFTVRNRKLARGGANSPLGTESSPKGV